jgi:hypothetical protein
MMLQQQLTILIKHQIPGRLRLIFSQSLRNPNELCEDVSNHEGTHEIRYTHITRSLLITFDHKQITHQELLISCCTSVLYGF